MKLRNYLILLIALSAVFLLSGCSIRNTAEKLDAAEHAVEQQFEKAENAVEDAIRPNNTDPATSSSKSHLKRRSPLLSNMPVFPLSRCPACVQNSKGTIEFPTMMFNSIRIALNMSMKFMQKPEKFCHLKRITDA